MAKTAGWCLILVLMLGGCAAPRGTTASMDPEVAKERATAFAERVGMPVAAAFRRQDAFPN